MCCVCKLPITLTLDVEIAHVPPRFTNGSHSVPNRQKGVTRNALDDMRFSLRHAAPHSSCKDSRQIMSPRFVKFTESKSDGLAQRIIAQGEIHCFHVGSIRKDEAQWVNGS